MDRRASRPLPPRALISVPVWVYLGFFGASNRDWLMTWVHRGQARILVLIGLGAVLAASYWWIQRRRKARACELRRVAGRE